MFKLLEKQDMGTIVLQDRVHVSDPCYDIYTWCAGTLENVLPGNYQCNLQQADTGDWGIRVANIEIKHTDFLDVEPTEIQKFEVGVDSGQAGIYDFEYFKNIKNDETRNDEWYDRVCRLTCIEENNPDFVSFEKSSFWKDEYRKPHEILSSEMDDAQAIRACKSIKQATVNYIKALHDYTLSIEGYPQISKLWGQTIDGQGFVSSSGDGDGGYECLVGRNDEGKIVAIKIDYYPSQKG